MCGYVAAKDKIYDVPLTTNECETIEDACIASLHFWIIHDCNIVENILYLHVLIQNTVTA